MPRSIRGVVGYSGEHMKQISQREQRETKNSTPKIEVMPNTMLIAPMHPRKQVKSFAEMSEDDHHQTSCAK